MFINRKTCVITKVHVNEIIYPCPEFNADLANLCQCIYPRKAKLWMQIVLLTHWGQVTHICISKLTIIGSDNGLSPSRRQAIIWTNAGILLIQPSGTNISEILIEIDVFSFKKMHLKMLSAKCRPFCLNLNVLILLVLRLEYSVRTRSISWLLMHWLLALPDHINCHGMDNANGQCKLDRSLTSMGGNFNYLCHLKIDKW